MSHLADAKKNNSELLEAQAHIWNQIFNFINSMSLKCDVELGIPDIIHRHGKPITISELNSALSIHPTKCHCLPRLMRVLIHSGIFALAKTNTQNEDDQEEEGYVLTNSSQLLLKNNPFSLVPYLQAMLDPVFTKPWNFTSTWFLNDDASSPFETVHGMSLWDHCGYDSKLNNLFNNCMDSETRLITSVLINQGKDVFDGLNSLVDLGGGIGTVAKAIAEAFPHIECTVLDLPHVVSGHPDTDNLKYVAGDMFEVVPPADAILIKSTLHDWSDEDCLKILKQCKKAIADKVGGKVIIIDMVMESKKEDNLATETQLFFDMLMMVLVTGKERNENEWAKLFSDAGFNGYKIIPIMGLRSIIEIYP